MKYLKQNAWCISWSTRWARRPHAEKVLSTTLYTPYLAEIWQILCRSFTIVCQLYCCSSKHNYNKALRITFNSRKTVSTSSMALATVNIDKIIKVTSAPSYVSRLFPVDWTDVSMTATKWTKNGQYRTGWVTVMMIADDNSSWAYQQRRTGVSVRPGLVSSGTNIQIEPSLLS